MKYDTINQLICALLFALTLNGCGGTVDSKPYPTGVYDSAGPIRTAQDDIVAAASTIIGQDGILVRVNWNLCDDDTTCLLDTIQKNLDTAASRNLKVALAVSDGHHIPSGIKNGCTTFPLIFNDQNQTLCLPWDHHYLQEKESFINQLGARFDTHPALAYVYFTGSCSTNGFEGHCRIDETAFTQAGYTSSKLSAAYQQIMRAYTAAFPTTPIAFEAHTLFSSEEVWVDVWNATKNSGQVGIAAWWCSERMTLNGAETMPVWPLVQEAATHSFAVCQTIGNFTDQPYRFSDDRLALDYGTETSWDAIDVTNAFEDTLNWAEGTSVHAGQSSIIQPFSVLEVWTADLNNVLFQERLTHYLSP
jgi:hypothetical protein